MRTTAAWGVLVWGVVAVGLGHGCSCQDETLNERTRPAFTPDPDRIDFGDVPVGVVATRRIQMTNRGELDLEVSAARTEGAPAFSASGAPLEIGGLETGSVTVSFAPTAAGPVSGTCLLESNADGTPITRVPLVGNGVAGSLCGPCNMPPQARCLTPNALLVYDAVGTCENNQCRYVARSIPCAGACVDATCTNPPDAGVPDAASPPDAAVPLDAGAPDAAGPRDAAFPPADAGNPFNGPCGPPRIVPYYTGGSFGGFQSVPGSGFQQTIVVTFECVVNRVDVTILDPDFPGNVMQAFWQGQLLGTAAFVGDGAPGSLTTDVQSLAFPQIDEIRLVPDPADYVAYELVTYEAP